MATHGKTIAIVMALAAFTIITNVAVHEYMINAISEPSEFLYLRWASRSLLTR